jgi:hypothetical protein
MAAVIFCTPYGKVFYSRSAAARHRYDGLLFLIGGLRPPNSLFADYSSIFLLF